MPKSQLPACNFEKLFQRKIKSLKTFMVAERKRNDCFLSIERKRGDDNEFFYFALRSGMGNVLLSGRFTKEQTQLKVLEPQDNKKVITNKVSMNVSVLNESSQ